VETLRDISSGIAIRLLTRYLDAEAAVSRPEEFANAFFSDSGRISAREDPMRRENKKLIGRCKQRRFPN